MKESKYNIYFEKDGKKYAFNGITCALAPVNDDFFKILSSCQDKDFIVDESKKVLFDDMKKGNYIVDDNVDELEFLKFLSGKAKFNNRNISLTIAPTLNCNFACPYCYESEKSSVISNEVKEAIYGQIEKYARKKENVSITWYGGEPLLVKDIIFSMSERIIDICKKNGVKYDAFMISNGYLFDDDTINSMVKSNITGIQITVDGPPRIHNLRRKLKASDKDTFYKILENIKKLKEANVKVNIRINIDKTNTDNVEELLCILKSHDLKDCKISLGHVRAYTHACNSIASSCLNTKEYAKENVKYQKILSDKGFDTSSGRYYPNAKTNYCCADTLLSFAVDPSGNLYKCWNDIGITSQSVGNIIDLDNDKLENNTTLIKYLQWSPFNYKECEECNILPLCMGGCPYEGLKNKTPDCEMWKYNLIETLKLTCDANC